MDAKRFQRRLSSGTTAWISSVKALDCPVSIAARPGYIPMLGGDVCRFSEPGKIWDDPDEAC